MKLIALLAVLVALAATGGASWHETAAYSPNGWSWGDDPQ